MILISEESSVNVSDDENDYKVYDNDDDDFDDHYDDNDDDEHDVNDYDGNLLTDDLGS